MLLSPDLLAMLSLGSNFLGTLCLFFVIRLRPFGQFPRSPKFRSYAVPSVRILKLNSRLRSAAAGCRERRRRPRTKPSSTAFLDPSLVASSPDPRILPSRSISRHCIWALAPGGGLRLAFEALGRS